MCFRWEASHPPIPNAVPWTVSGRNLTNEYAGVFRVDFGSPNANVGAPAFGRIAPLARRVICSCLKVIF